MNMNSYQDLQHIYCKVVAESVADCEFKNVSLFVYVYCICPIKGHDENDTTFEFVHIRSIFIFKHT